MTMISRWFVTASTARCVSLVASRKSIGSAAFSSVAKSASSSLTAFVPFSSTSSFSSSLAPLPLHTAHASQHQHRPVQHQHQQQRSRWTKAKKKRVARFDRNQELQEKGIPLPNPPYYFPIDTPVVNAVSMQERLAESSKHDESASISLKAKQQAQEAVLLHHMTDADAVLKLKMSDRVRKLFDLHNGSQREVVQVQKQQGMQLFQMRQGDTGSSAVQVVALTTRIQQLQTHFSTHKKDKHSKRGMDALYVRRRKLLDYMERKDFENYRKVVKTLGLVR